MSSLLPRFFFVLGTTALSLTAFLIAERFTPKKLDFATFPQEPAKSRFVKPVAITLPAINKTLPVIPAKQEGKKWETTPDGVSYLLDSPVPGEKGNSILYGHDWPSLLRDLPKTKPGDAIMITYADGREAAFEVAYTTVVTPADVSILKESKDARITIYTCVGLFDEKRFVVTALPKAVTVANNAVF